MTIVRTMIGGRNGRIVRVEDIDADDVCEMLCDEFRLAANEGLGHFDTESTGAVVDGTMELTVYGRKFLVTVAEVK